MSNTVLVGKSAVTGLRPGFSNIRLKTLGKFLYLPGPRFPDLSTELIRGWYEMIHARCLDECLAHIKALERISKGWSELYSHKDSNSISFSVYPDVHSLHHISTHWLKDSPTQSDRSLGSYIVTHDYELHHSRGLSTLPRSVVYLLLLKRCLQKHFRPPLLNISSTRRLRKARVTANPGLNSSKSRTTEEINWWDTLQCEF